MDDGQSESIIFKTYLMMKFFLTIFLQNRQKIIIDGQTVKSRINLYIGVPDSPTFHSPSSKQIRSWLVNTDARILLSVRSSAANDT